MNNLTELINELETKITHREKTNNTVSDASVGWHIHHSQLVVLQIILALERSNPESYRWKFNLNRFFVYTLNKIPRGRGKAPESVKPKEQADAAKMNKTFEILKARLPLLDALQPNNYFKHPYFGDLNVKAAIKMLKIHTKHHIDIVNDIIRS
jgi:hypothetical protein